MTWVNIINQCDFDIHCHTKAGTWGGTYMPMNVTGCAGNIGAGQRKGFWATYNFSGAIYLSVKLDSLTWTTEDESGYRTVYDGQTIRITPKDFLHNTTRATSDRSSSNWGVFGTVAGELATAAAEAALDMAVDYVTGQDGDFSDYASDY